MRLKLLISSTSRRENVWANDKTVPRFLKLPVNDWQTYLITDESFANGVQRTDWLKIFLSLTHKTASSMADIKSVLLMTYQHSKWLGIKMFFQLNSYCVPTDDDEDCAHLYSQKDRIYWTSSCEILMQDLFELSCLMHLCSKTTRHFVQWCIWFCHWSF